MDVLTRDGFLGTEALLNGGHTHCEVFACAKATSDTAAMQTGLPGDWREELQNPHDQVLQIPPQPVWV